MHDRMIKSVVVVHVIHSVRTNSPYFTLFHSPIILVLTDVSVSGVTADPLPCCCCCCNCFSVAGEVEDEVVEEEGDDDELEEEEEEVKYDLRSEADMARV